MVALGQGRPGAQFPPSGDCAAMVAMMNINDLVGADPELLDALLDLGLSQPQVDELGLQITSQLSEHTSMELDDLLTLMRAQDFLSHLDIEAIAHAAGCDVRTVQVALLRLASSVALFARP